MAAIWRNDGDSWKLATPTGFLVEETLHDLVHAAPHVLPLAGDPRIVVLGREVPCGSGYADLLAVEGTGRLVIVEVKLASNADARRAVIAQVLAYAASLRGLTSEQLDALLAGRLPDGHVTVTDVVAATDQEGSFDAEQFTAGLSESLATGRFRLILVLDSAPHDLVRLVGYVEAMTDAGLVIDLVTVAQYEAAGTRFLVPQRIEPDRVAEPMRYTPRTGASIRPTPTEGVEGFKASIEGASPEEGLLLSDLAAWAIELEGRGLVKLFSTRGTTRTTLVPQLRGYDAGLVTVANDNGPALWLWRTVFEKFVPTLIPELERLLGTELKQGMTVRAIDEDLLEFLRKAHQEAVGDPKNIPVVAP